MLTSFQELLAVPQQIMDAVPTPAPADGGVTTPAPVDGGVTTPAPVDGGMTTPAPVDAPTATPIEEGDASSTLGFFVAFAVTVAATVMA
jgi:hypothetical protein